MWREGGLELHSAIYFFFFWLSILETILHQITRCTESSWHVVLWQQAKYFLSVYCLVFIETLKQNV
jgi:hypothetical protein